MSNLSSLLKIAFYNSTGLNGLSKNIKEGREKKKLVFTTIMILFVGVIITVLSASYSAGLAMVLKPMGQLNLLLILAVIVNSILIIFTYVYKATGVLFGAKDYNLLMSLPIKNSVILASKLIEMMVVNYIITTLIMVPVSIVYFINSSEVSWIFFVVMIVGIILIPMIPVIVASIIAMATSYLSSRFKRKNIMSVVIGMVVTMGILYASIRINDIINYFVANGSSLSEGFAKVYPPANYLTNAMVNFEIVSLVKFIAVSIIPFAIFIGIFSRKFNQINKALDESYKRSNYKLGALKTSSPVIALTKEELRKYFSIPIYVMNTAVGMIIVLGTAILSLFKGEEFINTILQIPYIDKIISCGTLIIVIFGIGLCCTSVSSISLEGKNLWIKKTLPVSEKDIFKGKIFTNLIITIPSAVICNIIFYLALKFDLIYLLLNIVITIIFSTLSAILGLVVNLYFPKLEWNSATTVVKQSMAVFINMIFIFVAIALPIVFLAVLKIENIIMFLSITAVLLLAITFIVWNILMTKGIKQFNSL